MNELVREWISKAEGDWRVAEREFRRPKQPNYDAVCFHCQQCAEKYIKARLLASGRPFPKTHDLTELLTLLRQLEPNWEDLRLNLERLTGWAVEVRYPGLFATKEMAKQALAIAGKLRKLAQASLRVRKRK